MLALIVVDCPMHQFFKSFYGRLISCFQLDSLGQFEKIAKQLKGYSGSKDSRIQWFSVCFTTNDICLEKSMKAIYTRYFQNERAHLKGSEVDSKKLETLSQYNKFHFFTYIYVHFMIFLLLLRTSQFQFSCSLSQDPGLWSTVEGTYRRRPYFCGYSQLCGQTSSYNRV